LFFNGSYDWPRFMTGEALGILGKRRQGRRRSARVKALALERRRGELKDSLR